MTGEVGLDGVATAIDAPRRPDEHIKILVRPGLEGDAVLPPLLALDRR